MEVVQSAHQVLAVAQASVLEERIRVESFGCKCLMP